MRPKFHMIEFQESPRPARDESAFMRRTPRQRTSFDLLHELEATYDILPQLHMEFQYDKWAAFANRRTGAQQQAWERQERERHAAEIMQAIIDD